MSPAVRRLIGMLLDFDRDTAGIFADPEVWTEAKAAFPAPKHDGKPEDPVHYDPEAGQ